MIGKKHRALIATFLLGWACLASELAPANLPVPTVSSCDTPTSLPSQNDYVSHLDLTYEIVDGQQEALDLYLPAHVSNPPLIVTIHGGGWTGGDKGDLLTDDLVWVGQGYAAASLNYRLVTKGTNVFPAAVQDVRCAVQWLKSHAGVYRYNPNRIGAIGFSAGGHLVGMLGTASQSHGDLDSPACTETQESPSVNAVASYYGPMDLADWPASFSSFSTVSNFLGVSPAANPTLAAEASPIHYIDFQTPPFFMAQGTIDTTVPPPQATEMENALTTAHVPVNLFMVDGLGHAFMPFTSSLAAQLEPSNCTLLSFFDAALRHPVEKSRRSRP